MTSADACGSKTMTGGKLTALDVDTITVDGE